MNNELTETDERWQAAIEKIIKRERPGAELRWTEEGSTETHILHIQGPWKRYRLRFSQEALEATDDPANIPRLEREVRKELRVSESRKAVGYVKEPA